MVARVQDQRPLAGEQLPHLRRERVRREVSPSHHLHTRASGDGRGRFGRFRPAAEQERRRTQGGSDGAPLRDRDAERVCRIGHGTPEEVRRAKRAHVDDRVERSGRRGERLHRGGERETDLLVQQAERWRGGHRVRERAVWIAARGARHAGKPSGLDGGTSEGTFPCPPDPPDEVDADGYPEPPRSADGPSRDPGGAPRHRRALAPPSR
jgi:hypothetical protein